MTTTRAVVLARGLGSRMKAADPGAHLTEEQERAADAGLKTMMPVNGRPFLDYVLSGLADAGIVHVALVVAPDHQSLLDRYSADLRPARIALSFVVQAERAGHSGCGSRRGGVDGGSAVFDDERRQSLSTAIARGSGGTRRARSRRLFTSRPGDLGQHPGGAHQRVRDRPGEREPACCRRSWKSRASSDESAAPRWKDNDLISMNCWRFDARIFAACRDVPRSPRGEFELPEAVGLAARRGVPFRVLRASGGVLDLSKRGDAVEVSRRLSDVVVRV